MSKLSFRLLLLTPVFIVLANYLTFFPHEYAHSFTAWMLGDKSNPWYLHMGDMSWFNLISFAQITENVDYGAIVAAGHKEHLGWIALAGPIFINGTFYLLSLYALNKKSIATRPYFFSFLFWFNLMNLGNLFVYAPIRTFGTRLDAANFVVGFDISPWCIYVVMGYLVAFAIWYFFTRTLIQACINLQLNLLATRAFLMIISVVVLFGYFGAAGYFNLGEISYFLSLTSILAIPGVIAACWPTREWVKNRLAKFV